MIALGFGLSPVFGGGRWGGGAEWTPAKLFENGEIGLWHDPSDLSTLWRDTGGTVPVTADGDLVALVVDKSGNGINGSQATSSARPKYYTDGNLRWFGFDGVDDNFGISVPTGGITGTFYYAGVLGKGAFGIALPAGAFALGTSGGRVWQDSIYALILRQASLSTDEINRLSEFYPDAGDFNAATTLPSGMFRSLGLTSLPADMTLDALTSCPSLFLSNDLTSLPAGMTLPALTNGNSMFYANDLTSLPAGMTLPVLTDGYSMFRGNHLTTIPNGMTLPALTGGVSMFATNDLTSLPAGMTLPALTDGRSMFRDNSNLSDVPSDFAQDTTCNRWDGVFTNTSLTQTAIDNILTNLNATGTSNGTFDQSGGSAPSTTGQVAITAMRSRGWTITVTGGF